MAIAILLLESGVFLLTGSFGLNRFRREEGGGTRAFFNGSIRLDAQSPGPLAGPGERDGGLFHPMAAQSRIQCLFSDMTVRIPQGYSVRTLCSTAFGSISTPKGVQPGFGQVVCVVGDGLQVQMEIRCLFGQVNLLD